MLRSYQERGIEFLADHTKRGLLLADDPGLGKTLQALEAAKQIKARRVLVFGPAIARVSWQMEVEKFAPERLRHFSLVPVGARPQAYRLDLPDLMLVLSYDVFSRPVSRDRWLPALLAQSWDLLILDEAHYLKNDSGRAQAVYGPPDDKALQRACARVFLLSGTPAPNHVGELWRHYQAFWQDLVPVSAQTGEPLTEAEWQERYTRYEDTLFGRKIKGSRRDTVAGLRKALAPVILRRSRQVVLKDLPALQVQDFPLDLRPSQREDLNRRMEPLGDVTLMRRTNANGTLDLDVDAVSTHEWTSPLATLRRVLGEAKALPAAAWAEERLGLGQDKIILFAWHTKVIQLMAQYLRAFSPCVIMGSTPMEARAEQMHRFQRDARARVFIGQVLAAGTAITLTAASQVGLVEPSWVPGENEQAIARAWRMGQVNPVLATFLYIPETLDETVMRVFRRKATELADLYRDTPPDALPTRTTHEEAPDAR